jgi:hypothetical protein
MFPYMLTICFVLVYTLTSTFVYIAPGVESYTRANKKPPCKNMDSFLAQGKLAIARVRYALPESGMPLLLDI